jgi:2-C-methyl-D-erythritol 2,4-cyclodiphosphate synthase
MEVIHRVGHGLDAHRLALGRPLVLGGVRIDDAPRGADAHSDGDVVLHALADALLSGLALGDIGDHFPPDDPRWRGLDSAAILGRALELLRAQAGDWKLVNAAVVVVLDAPKLGPVRSAVAANVARLLGVSADRVGLSFKTSEGFAPDFVQASATVLLAAA